MVPVGHRDQWRRSPNPFYTVLSCQILQCSLGKDCRLCWAWDRIKLGKINFIANIRGDSSWSKLSKVFLAELLFRQLSSYLCPKVTALFVELLTTLSIPSPSGEGALVQGCPLLLCPRETTASCGLAVFGEREPTCLVPWCHPLPMQGGNSALPWSLWMW